MRTELRRLPWICGLAALLLSCQTASISSDASVFDPAGSDPIWRSDAPPRIAETAFRSAGSSMNAIVYEAAGPGPHPTVVLLHGLPGNERNLDLAHAMRRAGWNVAFFHYRGAWGSEGHFSFSHVLADVAAAVRAVREPAFAAEHRIDPSRIALVGHSMGGFAAVHAGAHLNEVRCVASLAGANLALHGRAAASSPAQEAELLQRFGELAGPLSLATPRALVDDVMANHEAFDLVGLAPALAPKALLVVAAENDTVVAPDKHHAPLVDAVRASGAAALDAPTIANADHSFSGQRVELARTVIGWLDAACASAF